MGPPHTTPQFLVLHNQYTNPSSIPLKMTNIKKKERERKLGGDREGLSILPARKFLVGTQGRRGVA